MLLTIIPQCLQSMRLPVPYQKMLLELFALWPSVRGRFNFTNLAHYSSYHERTLQRWFSRELSWVTLNCYFLSLLIPAEHELIAALDASFIPKSGKSTFGLGWFFNGQTQRVEKGLEASLLSVVDLSVNTAYAVEARQFAAVSKLAATDIVRYYRSRFQIEFLFRDAKSSLGLNHCQARNKQALQFHWNMTFSALNAAKAHYLTDAPKRISILSHKQRAANQQLLLLFSQTLGPDWNSIKSNPEYQTLVNYGAIM